jgi:hypothetical protein
VDRRRSVTRPVVPTFTATDVTGWTPEDVADLLFMDDDAQDRYTEDLARWSADTAAAFFAVCRDWRPSACERAARSLYAQGVALLDRLSAEVAS